MMNTHVINVSFDFDDDAIRKSIQGKVEKEVISNIEKEVKDRFFENKWYGSDDSISELVHHQVDRIVSEYRDQIIDRVCSKLVDKISRQKAFKTAIGDAINNETE